MKLKTPLACALIVVLAGCQSGSETTAPIRPDLGMVSAEEGATGPNTPVSNTGEILRMPEVFALDVSDPRSGTGSLATSNTEIPEADLNVRPLGSVTPTSVIGVDGRIRVNPTTGFPNRAIAYLVVRFPNGTGTCTGWFIGPRTVATAGHCVFDKATKTWATSITVYPGRNGSLAPYGSTTAARLFSVSGWTVSGSADHDYGAIQTHATKGSTVGWLGYRWQSSNTFPGSFTVKGYPGDKPAGTQWFMNGPVTNVNTYRLWYSIDTFGGQSGSPFYHWYTGSGCTSNCYYGVGIHTYGTSVSPFFGNSATRIRQAVYNNFVAWKNVAYP